MASAIATIAMLNPKCFSTSPNNNNPTNKLTAPIKPISLLSLGNLSKGISLPKAKDIANPTSTAIASAVFAFLSSSDASLAAQQIADLAEGSDSRGLALLLPLIPAIIWVLYNILQPALNQLERMRSEKSVIVGLGLGGGLATAGLFSAPSASASEVLALAEASSGDNRGLLLLFVITPAVAWVLYNILQPALNQINRMRS